MNKGEIQEIYNFIQNNFGLNTLESYQFELEKNRQDLTLTLTNGNSFTIDDLSGFNQFNYERIFGMPKKVVELLKKRGIKDLPPIVEPTKKRKVD